MRIKGAISSNIATNSDENLSWDSSAAIKNVKAWASDSDGNIDFDKYKQAFFWVDSENADKQGSYKLPFADVFDGELKAVWRGVAASMASLMGSRGGVDIPDNDRKPVYNSIVKYYKKFDKTPPEFKQAEVGHVKAFYDPQTKTAIASTSSVDRMGEVIDQSGWDLGNFKDNPVLLWAHDDRLPRIGTAKNLRIEKANGQPALMFEPRFNEATELSRAIKQIFEEEGGTFSVGFMPLEMDGNTYTKAELLEISAVNVPANPDARTLAYKSLINKGISSDVALQISGVKKGAIQDALDKDEDLEKKNEYTSSLQEVFCAFMDVYYTPTVTSDMFTELAAEFTEIVGKIADGTYEAPDMDMAEDEPMMQMSLYAKVLDNRSKNNKVNANEAKEPSSAPKRNKQHEEALRMAKILAKAADILNRNEKLPDEKRKQVTQVIKRASDIVIEQHKGELENG